MNEKQIMKIINNMNNKKKFNFTKILISVITVVWVITICFSLFLLVTGHPEPALILGYVQTAFMTGVVGYLSKSSVENAMKIHKNTEEKKEDNNDTD